MFFSPAAPSDKSLPVLQKNNKPPADLSGCENVLTLLSLLEKNLLINLFKPFVPFCNARRDKEKGHPLKISFKNTSFCTRGASRRRNLRNLLFSQKFLRCSGLKHRARGARSPTKEISKAPAATAITRITIKTRQSASFKNKNLEHKPQKKLLLFSSSRPPFFCCFSATFGGCGRGAGHGEECEERPEQGRGWTQGHCWSWWPP